jgi:hypothetical protein
MIEREKEKLKTPLGELKVEDLDRKPLMEYFVNDSSLLQEYTDLHKPFKQRFKYTIFFDLVWFMGIVLYARNANYYASILYPKRRKGVGNLILISGIHCIAFMSTLVLGNFVMLRINPFSFWKKSRDLNKRMVEQDPYKGVTWTEFMLLYAEIEEVEEKKAVLKLELQKTLVEQNKAL